MNSLCVFTDESGNTGSNLFDDTQPYFWIGSLICPSTFSKDYNISDSFHGCETDINTIDDHARVVINILNYEPCHVMVSKLNKRHHARLKFFDHVFDSGYNKGVSWPHYSLRPFRLSLAEAFSNHLSPRSEEQFWSFLNTLDTKIFITIIERVLWNVRNKEKDKRIKELLSDGLQFALDNPSEFTDTKRTLNDAPNIALFSIFVQELHYLARRHDISYEIFVHDQTSEFSKALKSSFEMLSQFEFIDKNEITLAEKAKDSFKEPIIRFDTRQSCLQLRIVDLILWTLTRVARKGYFKGLNNINELYDLLNNIVHFSYLTPEQMKLENQYYKYKYLSQNITQEDVERARNFVSKIDEKRKRALL